MLRLFRPGLGPVALFFVSLSLGLAAVPEPTPSPSPSPTPQLYSPETIADLKELQAAALTDDYAWRQVAHLANNIGPRLSGSAQAQHAVEYVAAELKALGLEVHLEKVMVPHWVRGEAEFQVLAPWPQSMPTLALGGSVGTGSEGIEADGEIWDAAGTLVAQSRQLQLIPTPRG